MTAPQALTPAPTVIVCGGRYFDDRERVFAVLDRIAPGHVIEGGATGADRFAYEWATVRGVRHTKVNPDWNTYGYAAGPIRNQKMLDDYHPALVVAFPGGRGTADMVQRAIKRGVRVRRAPEPEGGE